MPRIAALLACLLLLPIGAAAILPTASNPAPVANDDRAAILTQPTILGVVSNFSQGWQPGVLDAALALPATRFRDGMVWHQVEQQPGAYSTSRPTTAYPARLAERGGELTLIVAGTNPHHDAGGTPHTAAGVAAIGRFAAEMAQRFPAITTVEVGNEFNGRDFVRGKVREDGLGPRGGYHLALLRSVAERVRAVRPDVRIIGGAAHSIPAGYLWPILENGGAGLMDAIALHPYTTPIDQLRAQIGVLRRHPAARDLPIAVTEFGSDNAARAPDDLIRGYAMLATLGAESLYWYPLNERGDGMVPLVSRSGAATPAGEAFRFAQTQLAMHRARDVSPDPFTYAIAFGDRALVLWGEPRGIELAREDIAAFDSRGRRLQGTAPQLAPDRALILTSEQPFALGQDVQLACSTLVADTFHQFAYPTESAPDPARTPAEPGFASTVQLGSRQLDWQMLPGQQRGGVPWVPYLGREQRPGLRLTAERVLLRSGPGNPAEARWQYTTQAPQRLELEAQVTPVEGSESGWQIRVASGGESVLSERVESGGIWQHSINISPDHPLAVTLAPAANGAVAVADYRLRLHDPARCQPPGSGARREQSEN